VKEDGKITRRFPERPLRFFSDLRRFEGLVTTLREASVIEDIFFKNNH